MNLAIPLAITRNRAHTRDMNTNTATKTDTVPALALVTRFGHAPIWMDCTLWHPLQNASLTSDVQRAQAIFSIARPGALVLRVVRKPKGN